MPIPFNLPFVDNQALRNWAARLISDINAALSSGGGGGKGPSTSRITLVAGLQEADTDSTYKVFASSETVDPNALGTGTPSHTFRAVVNVPANSTG